MIRKPSDLIAEGIAWAFVVLAAFILFNAVRSSGEAITPDFRMTIAQGTGR